VSDIRQILETIGRSRGFAASDETLPLLYDELRTLAAAYMSHQSAGQTLQPTALVHEAWLRLTREDAQLWNDRAHFFRSAARAMRHILVDRARAKASVKRGANAQMLDIDSLNLADADVDERILLVDEMLTRLELENPRLAEVVSMKFFSGMAEKDIAAVHGTTERTVRRQWSYAKVRLFELLQEELKHRPAE
jgi:RNA polymerase sigma factor (TIGR02999 family)